MTQGRLWNYIEFFSKKTVVSTILIVSVMLIIFGMDLQFSTKTHIGVLYILIVMLSLWLPNAKYTIFFAIISTLLAISAHIYSIYKIKHVSYFQAQSFINLSLIISVIWVITLIVIYIREISIELQRSKTIYSAILNSAIDPIIIVGKNGMIKSASKTIEDTLGWEPNDIINKNFCNLLSEQYTAQYEQLFINNINNSNSNLLGNPHEVVALHRIQKEFPCEISINYIDIPELNEQFFTISLRNVSKRTASVSKLGWISNHDELTQLYNRRYCNEQIEKEWFRMMRNQVNLGLILIEVDYFRDYNHALGHQAGDLCLQKIARCLKYINRRASDIVARYSNTEFVVLLPNTTLSGIQIIAANIKNCVSELNLAHPNSPVSKKISVSMGVALMIPHIGCGCESLITLAEKALDEAKQTGRNKICLRTE